MQGEEDDLLSLIYLETRRTCGEESKAIGDSERTWLDQVTSCGDVHEEGVESAGSNPASSSWIYLVRGKDHPGFFVLWWWVWYGSTLIIIVRGVKLQRGAKKITDALGRLETGSCKLTRQFGEQAGIFNLSSWSLPRKPHEDSEFGSSPLKRAHAKVCGLSLPRLQDGTEEDNKHSHNDTKLSRKEAGQDYPLELTINFLLLANAVKPWSERENKMSR